jgi:HD-like signal output (HDOD) protein
MDELLSGVAKISGHREVLVRLNRLLGDENSGPMEFVETLRLDPGLSARVIAAANTVYFRGGSPVSSIDEAVIRVGVEQIRQLLLESISFEMMAGPLRSYAIPAGELWAQSICCALSMATLSKIVNRSSDVCYTIGLLHSVGMVVIDRWEEKSGSGRRAAFAGLDGSELWRKERAVAGCSNPEAAGALLASWRFPESISRTISKQETPASIGEFSKRACLLTIARWQSQTVRARIAYLDEPKPPEALIFETAAIELEQVAETTVQVVEQFLETKESIAGY